MKTKYSILLILLATFHSAFSSDDKPFKRVYIGISATPEITYRWLHSNFVPAGNSQAGVQGTADYGNKHTIPEFGVNVAAKVGINLTHWLAIESGIGYSLIRYRYHSDEYYAPNVYLGTSYVPNDNFNTTDEESYHYMTVPVGLRFSMGHRAVRGIIAAGVDFDFLLKREANYTYAYADGSIVTGQVIQQPNNFNTFNLSPYLGIGMDCYLSPAVVLRIMPQAQMQSFKNINTPVTQYLWNMGLNVSFLFGL
jgi:outer membrane protein with beta-barrel domain